MKALIVVDPQNDFMPNGNLAVTDGDKIIPIINNLMKSGVYDVIVITKDWHPDKHKSFASQHPDNNEFDVIDLNGVDQVLWPEHCIEGTQGAEFHSDLNMGFDNLYIFKKGMNAEIDSYSGFYENDHETSTGLTNFLQSKNVEVVDVVGLALDFCVKYTAIDAANEGFETSVLKDACRGIGDDMTPIFDELVKNNVYILNSTSND
jgi:nicotinamidase/pyrazinamidase